MRTANITLDLYTILVVTVLLSVCIVQRRQSKLIQTSLMGWMASHILMLACDAFRWRFRGKISRLLPFTLMFFGEYILVYISLIFFHYYFIGYIRTHVPVNPKLRLLVWPISVIMPVLWVLSYGNRWFYTITYNAVNVPGPYYYFSQLPALLLILFDMVAAFAYRKKLGWRTVLNLWLYMCLPVIAFPLQFAWNAQILFIGITLSLLSRYATVNSEQSRLLAESRAKLAESRIAITMSQIQPHFLYNALGSISALCDSDPTQARDATDHFADYLRMNLESMSCYSPIPFQTELNHIETYVWLEKMRFGEKLNVRYDIRVKDFSIPALSVQPIVENAIKHGICTKETKGWVEICTYDSIEYHYITVSDNGVGFDPDAPPVSGHHKRPVGIENVRSRLQMMVGGDLTIQSRPGVGTEATIRIPKEAVRDGRKL